MRILKIWNSSISLNDVLNKTRTNHILVCHDQDIIILNISALNFFNFLILKIYVQ